MTTETVKGFRDFTGEEAVKRAEIRKILVETFEKYGFEPAETPLVEYEEFVKGENANDEAVSDVFRLKDKGERNLALRYEFTFQLKRIMQNKKLPYKRYQIGEVFRDEPVSANRFRQITQCDVDIVGSDLRDEAEVLAVVNDVLKSIGVKPIILINNRKLLDEILKDNDVKDKDRSQVLREIDKIDKLSENEVRGNLRKLRAENVLDSFKKGEECFSKFENYKDVISLIEYCRIYGIKAQFSPSLARGLSYYNGSVFEVKAEGIKETIVAGGSYIFNGVQCTGLSFGLERLCLLTNIKDEKEKFLVVSLEQDKEAIKLAEKLREKGETASLLYGKPSKALEYANSCNYNKVIFVGQNEVKEKKFKIKDMKSGKESLLKI
ncbi:MAG: ATP phosphoribosyltransferase regulatory subunit [Nanoarchaeota archaeon]